MGKNDWFSSTSKGKPPTEPKNQLHLACVKKWDEGGSNAAAPGRKYVKGKAR